MTLSTKQNRAVAWANNAVQLAQQVIELKKAIDDWILENTDEDWMTFFNGCPTAPWATNGTQGTTDTNPVNTNPVIDPAIGNSWTGLNGLLLGLQNMQSAISGQAIAVNRDVFRASKDILSGK